MDYIVNGELTVKQNINAYNKFVYQVIQISYINIKIPEIFCPTRAVYNSE